MEIETSAEQIPFESEAYKALEDTEGFSQETNYLQSITIALEVIDESNQTQMVKKTTAPEIPKGPMIKYTLAGVVAAIVVGGLAFVASGMSMLNGKVVAFVPLYFCIRCGLKAAAMSHSCTKENVEKLMSKAVQEFDFEKHAQPVSCSVEIKVLGPSGNQTYEVYRSEGAEAIKKAFMSNRVAQSALQAA